ncbi:MAG: Ig-like domain-containing protein [Candidatus Krumholzibacteria bacterium]
MKSRMLRTLVLPAILLVAGVVSNMFLPMGRDGVLAAVPMNLEIVSFSTPSDAARDDDISSQLSVTIRNSGTEDINSEFYVGFYLSPDAVITTEDLILVTGRKIVVALAAGATMTVPVDNVSIPRAAPLGSGYLGVIVDEFDLIAEGSEVDNTGASPVIIDASVPMWVRQFGSALLDHGAGISAVGTTELYITGRTKGTLVGQSSAGGVDAYVRKYDANGTEIWTRQFGTPGDDITSSVVANASAVFVAGSTDDVFPTHSSAGGIDVFICKYDAGGTVLWTDQFGSSADDEATGISSDGSSVYVTGFTLGTLPGETSAGGYDAFVRKYDLAGTVIWTRQFGTAGTDKAFAISADASGIYVTGSTDGVLPGQSGLGLRDSYVRKYDSDGNEIWTRQFGSSSVDDAFAIACDPSGLFVTGSTYGALPGESNLGDLDAYVVKYDVNGNELWTRQFGTNLKDEACAISLDPSGVNTSGYTTGTLPGEMNLGGEDAFLQKYDLDGNEIWTRQFGTASDDRSLAISTSPLGVNVAGFTAGTLDGQVSEGLEDAFVLLDDNDNLILGVVEFSGPATALVGGAIGDDISLTIQNAGKKATQVGFSVGLYISTDTTITLADQLLVNGRQNEPIMVAGEVRVVTFPSNVTIPAGAGTGPVFLGVIIDEFDEVEDEDESDNTAFSAIILTTDTGADSDGDGVPDIVDLCPLEDASFFDRDGDGCLDDILSARHLEYWPPEDLPLPYFIHENGISGITDGSDFAALQAGMDVWSSIPGAEYAVSFQATTTQADAQALDGINLITFEDPDFAFPAGVLAVGISTSFLVPTMFNGTLARPGQIVDADIIFNPTKSFKTAMAGSGTDTESVTAHEALHLFGVSHAAVKTSTMFFVLPPGEDAASPTPEDEQMVLKSYPSASALATMSRLTGTVLDGTDLSPVPGVIVYVMDTATGDTIANDYTLPPFGTFEFLGIPDGTYNVGIHPLNGTSPIGFIAPQNINQLIFDEAVTVLVPEFWDLAESKFDDPTVADPVTVTSGTTTDIQIITNVDETGPTVTESSPTDNGLDVAIDAAVLIAFSEAIASGSIQGNFALTDTAAGLFISGSAAVLEDDSTLAFLPGGNLSFDTVYKLELGTGLTDQFGNGLQAPFVLHFTTEVQPAVGITSLVPTHGPVATEVTIHGFGFESDPGNNLVTFGGLTANIISASPSQLVFEVPAGAPVGVALVGVTNLLRPPPSNELAYTVLPVDDVARGFEAAVVALGALPRSIAVLPDGSRAVIATNAGASVVVVDPGRPDYLLHTPIDITGGLNEISITPTGVVYAVSRLNEKLYRLNVDPALGSVGRLSEKDVGAVPRGLFVLPNRAYIPTDASEVQIWDITSGSPTFERQIGEIIAEPNLRGKMAVNPAGNLLLGLSGIGKVLVFDLDLDSLVAEINVGPDPNDVIVDPLGDRAYIPDEFGFTSIVNLNSLSHVTDIPIGGTLRGGAIAPTGNFFYVTNRERDLLDVIDLREGSPTFRGLAADIDQRANPVDVALTPDGIFALSLSEAEQAMVVTGIGVGPVLRSMSRHAGPVGTRLVLAGVDFTAESSTTVSFNGIITTPEQVGDSVLAVAVPPGATDGPVTVRVTNLEPPVEISNAIFFDVLDLPTPAGGLRLAAKSQPVGGPQLSRALAIPPDGEVVAVGGDAGELFVLDANSSSATFTQFIASAVPLSSSLADVAITPDGRRAYVLSKTEQFVPVVNIDRNSTDLGTVIDSVDVTGGLALERLSISPDGFFMLISDPGLASVHIVDIREGSAQANQVIATTPTADVPLGINGLVGEMTFHPAGQFAYLAVQDSVPAAILVMDVGLGSPDFGMVVHKMPLVPPGSTPDEMPISISFTPDGSRCFVLTSQKSVAAGPNRTVLTLNTSAPANVVSPTLLGSELFSTTAVAADEHIHVSPRGDRAVLNILSDGFSHLNVTTSPTIPVLDQSGGALHSGGVDFSYSSGGALLYATSTSQDSVFVYDFTTAQELVKVSGDNQTGVINQTLPDPLKVRVINTVSGDPSAGVAVTFDVTADDGSFETGDPAVNPTTQVVVTDADGFAEVDYRLGSTVGAATQGVRASSLGLTGSPVDFVANTLNDPDSLPLTVSSFVPSDGQMGVNTSTAIQTTFSRGVNPTSVNSTNYFLRESVSLAQVPTIVGFTDLNRKISLTPVHILEPGKTYEIVATTGIIAALGDALSEADTASFTTVPPPPLALSAISPPSAAATVGIVLSGTSFDPVPANNTVLFDAVVGTVTEAGDNFLNVTVPLGAATGEIRVVIVTDTSNALPFTVLVPSLSPADDVLGAVGTGSSTRSLAITPDGAFAYGVSPDNGTVVPIDLVTLTTLPSIQVGDTPFAIIINPDGTFAYVVNFLSGTLSIIDVDSGSPGFNSVTETVIVGTNPVDLVITPDGDRVVVANAGSDDLSVIDTDNLSATFHTVLSTVGRGDGTRSLAITPDGGLLYVGTDDGYVILSALDFGVLGSVGGGSSTRSLKITPDGSLLVVLTTEGDVLIYDIAPGSPSENEVLAEVGGGTSTRSLKITPDGAFLWLVQNEGDIIIIVSLDIVGSVSVLDPNAVVTPQTLTVVGTISTGADPAAVAFDPSGTGIALVTNAGDATMTILGLLADVVVQSRPTDPTSMLNPPFRDIRAAIELPAGFNPLNIVSGSLAMNGLVSVTAVSSTLTDVDDDGLDEIHVEFDRIEFQNIVGQGAQVPVTVTGLASGQEFSGTDSIRTFRPTLLAPTSEDEVFGGATFDIRWQSPAFTPITAVDFWWSPDDGQTWIAIVLGAPNTEVLNWWIPRGFDSPSGRVMLILYTEEGESTVSIGAGMSEAFTVHGNVPVTLGSFTAVQQDRAAVLKWQTLLEVGFSGFHVLRSDKPHVGYERLTADAIPGSGRPNGSSYEFRDTTVRPNQTYYYKLEEVSSDGAGDVFGPFKFTYRAPFTLEQNFPNPFNPTTTIRFTLAQDSHVKLVVYDVAGRRVQTLVNEKRIANHYDVEWDGRNSSGHSVASGVYFYKIVAGKFSKTRKMLLLK